MNVVERVNIFIDHYNLLVCIRTEKLTSILSVRSDPLKSKHKAIFQRLLIEVPQGEERLWIQAQFDAMGEEQCQKQWKRSYPLLYAFVGDTAKMRYEKAKRQKALLFLEKIDAVLEKDCYFIEVAEISKQDIPHHINCRNLSPWFASAYFLQITEAEKIKVLAPSMIEDLRKIRDLCNIERKLLDKLIEWRRKIYAEYVKFSEYRNIQYNILLHHLL